MKRVPASLLWFLATGVIVVLQLIPITGIFLMFALAAFWSIFTINAGFVCLAFEALVGRVPRLWLIAPVLWFGGYAIAAGFSHAELSTLQEQASASNGLAAVPFDPSKQSLVFAKADSSVGSPARTLLQNADLDVAFGANPNYDIAKYVSERVAPAPVCAEARKAGGDIFSLYFDARATPKGLCTVSQPEDPEGPLVKVSTTVTEVPDGLLPVRFETVTITAPGSQPALLTTGSASALKWFPMPAIGCGLNSGAASWDCDWGFLRDREPIAEASAVLIQKALGLPPRSDRAISDVAAKEISAQIASYAERKQANEFRRFRAMYATLEPEGRFEMIEKDPALLSEDADEMAEALTRADKSTKQRKARQLLAQTLVQLPRDAFLTAIPHIFVALKAEPDKGVGRLGDIYPPIEARAGDAGTGELDWFIGRMRGNPGYYRAGPPLAICRMGPAAADKAAPALIQLYRSMGGFGRDQPAKEGARLALLRLGRWDPSLDKTPAPDGPQKNANGDEVTPASPPSACALKNWPTMPD